MIVEQGMQEQLMNKQQQNKELQYGVSLKKDQQCKE